MRAYIVLIFFLLIDIYAFQAIRLALQDVEKWVRISIYSLYWFASLAFVALFFLEADRSIFQYIPSQWRSFILAAFFISFLSKLFMSSMLLIDDLRRLFKWGISLFVNSEHQVDLGRSSFLRKAALIMGALPLAILSYGIFANAFRYKIFRRKVKIKGLASDLVGLKIVQISDIHSGSFWKDKPLAKAVEMINKESADLVFFTGDLVNEMSAEILPYINQFKQVQSKYGVYSVLGNHDYGDYHEWPSAEAKEQNMNQMYQAHKDLGWDLLLNESRQIQVKDSTVQVIGVENYSAKPHFPKYGDMLKATQDINEEDLCLLLSHDPTHWDSQVIKQHKYVDITFSGHTHGMQFGIEIPGVIRWSPAKFMYPRWADLYQEGNQYLYVNRGFGFLGYPGRVGILPEITVLELEQA